jgi:apolipoprotein N-acyltransferase
MILLLLSGVMLGASFPPSPLGILACFGLVPLLIVLADIRGIWEGVRTSYVTILVFHVITLNWTGGYAHGKDVYMMIAGAVTMIAHPLFYFLPIGAYQAVKKHLGTGAALFALPFFWVAYEYSHSLSEWSFPWLTLGHSQSYELARIQFISLTGVFGLSFWILWVNVFAYVLYSRVANGLLQPRSRAAIIWVAGLFLLYELPVLHGLVALRGEGELGDRTLNVGIVQPNVDPWEKWSGATNGLVDLHVRMTEDLLARKDVPHPDLVLWPETALPYLEFVGKEGGSLGPVHKLVNNSGSALLTGMPVGLLYKDSLSAPPTARRLRWSGQRYDTFNGAALFEKGIDGFQWYGKMKMVPFAERIPYAEMFQGVNFLQWGVGIGGWQIGRDTTIFLCHNPAVRFASLICYESVYPGFVTEFVRKGAEFLAIITIDSWWDHMSGAYQHQQIAVFRAVENRRWVVRCAVGGISCYIDPYGRAMDKTELFTARTLSRTIGLSHELTFYTEHGDWLGTICVTISGLVLAAVLGRIFTKKIRRQAP